MTCCPTRPWPRSRRPSPTAQLRSRTRRSPSSPAPAGQGHGRGAVLLPLQGFDHGVAERARLGLAGPGEAPRRSWRSGRGGSRPSCHHRHSTGKITAGGGTFGWDRAGSRDTPAVLAVASGTVDERQPVVQLCCHLSRSSALAYLRSQPISEPAQRGPVPEVSDLSRGVVRLRIAAVAPPRFNAELARVVRPRSPRASHTPRNSGRFMD